MLLCATQLSAQITTYIAPPRPAQPSSQAIATADSARRDSVTQVSMRNMKEWVDSAAGVPVPRYDTAVSVVRDSAGHTTVTTFSSGTVAPETASDLPTLAILGVVGLVVGAGLLTTRSRG
jgi:hypothetical protein